MAIGVAGMEPLLSYVGAADPHGYHLQVSVSAVADERAGAAELVMGKISGIPAALARGFASLPALGPEASPRAG